MFNFEIDFDDLEEVGRGYFSSVRVFTDPDDSKKYVMKRPIRDDVPVDFWLDAQKRASQAMDFARNVNASTNLFVPKIKAINEELENPYIIEDYASGQLLTKKLLLSLTEDEQEHVCTELAVFLNALHHSGEDLECYPCEFPAFSETQAQGKIRFHPNAWIMDKFEKYVKNITGCNIVPIHNDIHSGNLVYDRKNKTLSILDFVNAELGIPFSEFKFMEISRSHGVLPRSFVDSTVDIYNFLQKERNQVNGACLNCMTSTIAMIKSIKQFHKNPFVFADNFITASKDWVKYGLHELRNRPAIKSSNIVAESVPSIN